MLIKTGASVRVLGNDPDRSLCGSGTQSIFGEIVKQTKRGQNALWEVKFDNGETHELAASWIELKLWSKSIQDEEDDDDDDEGEESSDQASSKDDDEGRENEEEEEEAENTAGPAGNAETGTQASTSDKEQPSGAQKRQNTCGNCGAVGHNRAGCKEPTKEGGTRAPPQKKSRKAAPQLPEGSAGSILCHRLPPSAHGAVT